MTFRDAILKAVRQKLDGWTFRRGILTPSDQYRMTVGGSWAAQIRRVVRPELGQTLVRDRKGRAFKRTAAGLFLPMHESFAWTNLIPTVGLNYIADTALSGGTPITTWYLGLTAATPSPAAGDTMGSHAGWSYFTGYSESVRQTWTDAGPSAGVVTNAASAAVFTSNADAQTVGGAFLTSVSTKSGSTGTLFACGAFSGGNKSLDDTETLTVTAQFTFADA